MNYDKCRIKCSKIKGCTWYIFQFMRRWRCTLHKHCHWRWSYWYFLQANSEGYVTSPMECPNPGSGCHNEHTRIPDNLPENVQGMPDIGVVSGHFACQRHCQETPKCNYWSYSKKYGTCRLLANNKGKTLDKRFVSGPRDCGGK